MKISQVWTGEDNDIIPLLERVLTCRSYRHVVQLLRRHPWVTRQVIYELRTLARINVPMSHEIQGLRIQNKKEVEASRQVRIRHCGSRARDGKFASPDLSRSLGVE